LVAIAAAASPVNITRFVADTVPLRSGAVGEEYALERFHAMSGIGRFQRPWSLYLSSFFRMITRFRKAVARLPGAFRRNGNPSPEPMTKPGRPTERKHDRLNEGPAFDFKGTLPYPHFIIIGAPKCGTSWLRGAASERVQLSGLLSELAP
jgi:hypothetical protein